MTRRTAADKPAIVRDIEFYTAELERLRAAMDADDDPDSGPITRRLFKAAEVVVASLELYAFRLGGEV
jgi:hypothetical protein